MAKLAKIVTCLRLARAPLLRSRSLSVTSIIPYLSATRNISTIHPTSMSQRILIKTTQLLSPQRSMSTEPTEIKELEDRVLYNLRLYDKIDQDKLSLGAHFIKDLGLDSLDHVEIIMAMENEFGHYIPDVDAEKLLTPQEIIDYLADKLDVFE